jgi:hypothetical protein
MPAPATPASVPLIRCLVAGRGSVCSLLSLLFLCAAFLPRPGLTDYAGISGTSARPVSVNSAGGRVCKLRPSTFDLRAGCRPTFSMVANSFAAAPNAPTAARRRAVSQAVRLCRRETAGDLRCTGHAGTQAPSMDHVRVQVRCDLFVAFAHTVAAKTRAKSARHRLISNARRGQVKISRRRAGAARPAKL